MKAKRIWKRIGICVAVVVLALAGTVAANKFCSDFTQLNATDQAILTEYDLFCSQEGVAPLWQGFCLSDKTVALLSEDSVSVYLVNPTHEIKSAFAQKISLPDSFSVAAVYRVSVLLPEIWRMKITGSFNTVGATYSLFGDDVYYVKYNKAESLEQQYTSLHFALFLSHEAFHYYMQEQWKIEDYADSESLSDRDLQLMREEYDVLEKIHLYLLNGENAPNKLDGYAKQYVSIMDARMAANPIYTTAEIAKETAEGSATYVGVKTAKMVGYDYGVMYFDNAKNVSFADVFPQIEAGNIELSYLYSRMPYETGALLCQMLDALNVPDWQQTLNDQTLEAPQTLYSVIKSYVESTP
ncbi:MAG: hypothetical protein Q4B96_03160 [Bacillota bacterium]|nr:hypothetical protein [Bacillota bacterium]